MTIQSISSDVVLGEGTQVYSFTNLYGCQLGKECKVGTFVEIQRGVKIGDRCKISSHSFLCEGVVLEDHVFIGHGVMFTNDKWPRATNSDGNLQGTEDWTCHPTLVKKGASIGSGSTILCGITIGEGALIGAGSVVTKDIPAHTLAVGNPARVIKAI